MNTKIYYLALVLLAGTACRKQVSKEMAGSQPVERATSINSDESGRVYPYNPGNPADTIGIIHNQALDFVFKNMLMERDSSLSGKRKSIVRFFESRYGTNIAKLLEQNDREYGPAKGIDIRKLPEDKAFGPTMSGYLSEIIEATFQVKRLQEYTQFYNVMVGIEARISQDQKKLNPLQKDQLLHVASIVRHSMWFWMHFPPNGNEQTPEGFFRSWLGLQADMHYAMWALISFQEFRNLAEYAAGESSVALWYYDAWL